MSVVVVTGGAGFLGSHLVDALLERGHRVVAVDNLQTGTRDNLRHAVERHGDNFDFCKADITDIEKLDHVLESVMPYEKIDMIFNFACPASPVAYQSDPVHTMMTCVLGTRNMLSIAWKHNAVFIHASTSEIYGDPEVHPQREDYRGCVNPIGPRSCYDEGKRAAETLVFDYIRTLGLRAKVARIFNTYGPRMAVADGRVVSNFIVNALRGTTLQVYGSGEQTRSFCYVDDLIRGFLALMDTPDDFTGPVNLGNPAEYTIFELMQKVFALVNPDGTCEPKDVSADFPGRMGFAKLPQDDPQRRKPDITLARTCLDWEPRVPLMEGLARTIEYFREVL